jgi:hypothetical protein
MPPPLIIARLGQQVSLRRRALVLPKLRLNVFDEERGEPHGIALVRRPPRQQLK